MNGDLSLDELKAAFSEAVDKDIVIVSYCKASLGSKAILYNPMTDVYSVRYMYHKNNKKAWVSVESLEKALVAYNDIFNGGGYEQR